MEHKIIVVGIGPGNPAYVLPVALQKIKEATVLIGGTRALAEFGNPKQEQFPIKSSVQVVIDYIKTKLSSTDVVVMVSGDPGYYSMLHSLRQNFNHKIIEVIPGISAMQLAFAKLSLPWQNAILASFHGRMPEPWQIEYQPGKIVGMLTDNKFDTMRICQYLIEHGWPQDTTAHICARLSYPDESIVTTTLAEGQAKYNQTHCILIIEGGPTK